ncbi:hypothetical protein [Oligella urethralis]|uniref:hypothetical protein n=1 Tax=Oligella urethralis TaxID=90245 RepID=UPI00288BCBAB|nr:hypothetical protein [Oligella urethralis]
MVLCFGYLKLTSTPFGKITLRRNQGWEAYAHLAKNGIEILIPGLLLTLSVAVMPLYILATLVYLVELFIELEIKPYAFVYRILSFDVYRKVYVFDVLVICFSYFYYYQKHIDEANKQAWKESFKNQDAVLNIIFEAAETQTPLRISLKSRKVYIGIIESEQFEREDIDNIVIIPYLSGHRDKDTLRMIIDHNYHSIYQKKNILETDSFSKLSKFRVVIRLEELESLSFFDSDYFVDFGDNDNNSEHNQNLYGGGV